LRHVVDTVFWEYDSVTAAAAAAASVDDDGDAVMLI